MSPWLIVVATAAMLSAVGAAVRVARARRTPADTVIRSRSDHTEMAPDGAVRSTQSADIVMAPEALEELWTPANLERLARTYWRFLTRVTLGLIRVRYADAGRDVVLVARPLVLLSFGEPEYELDGDRALVRWGIERGLLVARRGRAAGGRLQIEVSRRPPAADGRAVVHVEVEVAGFHPAIASAFSRFVYSQTQSRIHVLVTHSFLRSLARLDLAESRVGQLP